MQKIITKTKHEQIKGLLKKELLSDKYLPGARFYSQNKLAEYFDVSPLIKIILYPKSSLSQNLSSVNPVVLKIPDQIRPERR